MSEQLWETDTCVIYMVTIFAKLRFRKAEITKLIKIDTGRRDRGSLSQSLVASRIDRPTEC